MHLVMIKDRNRKNTTEAEEMKEEAIRIHRKENLPRAKVDRGAFI